MKLTREEKKLCDKHIMEQKKIRKVDKNMEKSLDFEQRLEMIMEESYFAIGEFLICNNFHTNEEKRKIVWEYFRKRL